MKLELTEVLWLDEHDELSLAELAELSRLSEAELLQLVDAGVIVPAGQAASRPTFAAHCVVTVRTACRLRDDFELDGQGVAVALALLERIRDLEAQIRDLRAHLPQRMP